MACLYSASAPDQSQSLMNLLVASDVWASASEGSSARALMTVFLILSGVSWQLATPT